MAIDILLNEATEDLEIKSGDFVTGDPIYQNQRRLLLDDKGDWKQSPDAGVGLMGYLDDDDKEGLTVAIREQLKADGQTVRQIIFTDDGKIKVDAI